ncbi:hypothetical protein HOY82DRAFT_540774 [Tuber indicum]|nr:hypothetical protein HOY82DRAFT_540774 [Tuber indicum]
MSLSKKDMRKENRIAQFKGSNPWIVELEEDLEKEKKLARTLVARNKQPQRKNGKSQSAKKKLKDEMKELERQNQELSEQLEAATKGTLVPIVAAVVLKALYKRGLKVTPESSNNQVNREEMIRDRKGKYADFGCENEAQVDELADVWSGVIDARNTVAHLVTGDDVVGILPYCGDQLHNVLDRGFTSLWGISPDDWRAGKATPRQKALKFRNFANRMGIGSDCELERLG